jgi:uncharacterized protein (DUF362 family)/NAD-dependent dihydropyrimidine dehydrogenase PreA subunit
MTLRRGRDGVDSGGRRPDSEESPVGSTVALVRCETYNDDAVYAAVGRGLELLGGVERFVTGGESLLLKPNLLVASAPGASVTTHPSVFAAAARHLAEAGATLSYGDSPAVGRPEGAAKRAGLVDVATELGIPFADFTNGRDFSAPEGRLVKRWFIAEGVLAADGIVSLPKMKTHALTRMTGAVKNQFGCIPGARKGEFHARMPDIRTFAQMLVDLCGALAPRLYVMDGIVAMEGNGPRGGDPRPVGVILLSDDPVALDATACRLMGLDPALVETVTLGQESGLGVWDEVTVLGDPLEENVAGEFVANRRRGSTTGPANGTAAWLARTFIVPRPFIVAARCTSCGTCVRVCPVDPKAVDWTHDADGHRSQPPVHDYQRCIRCYCCQEMCPERAIEVSVPLLGRVIHR